MLAARLLAAYPDEVDEGDRSGRGGGLPVRTSHGRGRSTRRPAFGWGGATGDRPSGAALAARTGGVRRPWQPDWPAIPAAFPGCAPPGRRLWRGLLHRSRCPGRTRLPGPGGPASRIGRAVSADRLSCRRLNRCGGDRELASTIVVPSTCLAPRGPGRAQTTEKQVLQPNSELTVGRPAGRGAQTRTKPAPAGPHPTTSTEGARPRHLISPVRMLPALRAMPVAITRASGSLRL